MACNTCKMCESADKKLESFVASKDVETAFHRTEDQKVKCGFGLQGVCCRLCSNGPCRVTPKSPRGICGADADTIVARNFLRAVASGAACYLHVVENTAKNLKNVGITKGVVKGEKTLNQLAEMFGIESDEKYDKCIKVADKVINDLYKSRDDKMELVEKIAYAPRVKKWKELGIMPGGAKSEVFDAIVNHQQI
ncbi:prismane/CO dehydrogenase family protein [Clostridioides difficile 842]|nr:prismane/CO dehydrogenase family protein [Clostridioides difficile]EQF98994.1 prismane/CO dehydrogenase family protein [Clostridioides difficile 842]